jgi:hypothetical protein
VVTLKVNFRISIKKIQGFSFNNLDRRLVTLGIVGFFLLSMFVGLVQLPLTHASGASAITLVQGPDYGSTYTANSISVTLGSTPTQGNLLIACICAENPSGISVTSITETGVAWAQSTSEAFADGCVCVWQGAVNSGASRSITINLSTIASWGAEADVFEWSGLTGLVDQTAGYPNTAGVTNPSTGTTGVTTQANELCIGCIASGEPQSSATNGFTLVNGTTAYLPNYVYFSSLYDVVSSTGTYGSSVTLSPADWGCGCIATFKTPPATSCLVVRGEDDSIWYRIYNSTSASWNDWNSLPTGTTIDSPAAAVVSNTLYVVVRGMDGASLWFSSVNLTSSSFSGWTQLSGSTPSAPTLTSNGTALALFVQGEDNGIWYCVYTIATQTWTSWSELPSGTTPDSPAASLVGNELYVVVGGMDGASLWFSSVNLTSSSFSGWTQLSGSTPSKPTLTS